MAYLEDLAQKSVFVLRESVAQFKKPLLILFVILQPIRPASIGTPPNQIPLSVVTVKLCATNTLSMYILHSNES